MNIPNLPVDKLIDDETKDLHENWRKFFDQLVNQLQVHASNEGIVHPTQSSANILKIQGNQLQNLSYTAQYGTGLYNSSDNTMMFAVNNGSGAPIFKTATLT